MFFFLALPNSQCLAIIEHGSGLSSRVDDAWGKTLPRRILKRLTYSIAYSQYASFGNRTLRVSSLGDKFKTSYPTQFRYINGISFFIIFLFICSLLARLQRKRQINNMETALLPPIAALGRALLIALETLNCGRHMWRFLRKLDNPQTRKIIRSFHYHPVGTLVVVVAWRR